MIKVNAIGDNCPIPVIKTKKAMKELTGPDTTRLCHFIKSKSSKNIVFINVFGRLIQNNTTYVNVPKRS